MSASDILWAIQRVYLGPEYKGPHPEALTQMNSREIAVAVVILVFAVILGIYPTFVFEIMEPSTQQLVEALVDEVFGKVDQSQRDHVLEQRRNQTQLCAQTQFVLSWTHGCRHAAV